MDIMIELKKQKLTKPTPKVLTIYDREEYLDRIVQRKHKKIQAYFDMRTAQGEQKYQFWLSEKKRMMRKMDSKYRLSKRMEEGHLLFKYKQYDKLKNSSVTYVSVAAFEYDLDRGLALPNGKRILCFKHRLPDGKNYSEPIFIKKLKREAVTSNPHYGNKSVPLSEKLCMFLKPEKQPVVTITGSIAGILKN